MMLMQVLGLSKFNDSWEGPFEVLHVVTPVTFEIAAPVSVMKKRIVHVNYGIHLLLGQLWQ